MASRKLIITPELKNVLVKINSDIARLLLQEDIDDNTLSHPEKNFNYFDLSHTSKGHLSYLTKDRIDKIELEDKNFWEPKKRYHARPGSVIKKLFKIHDWELENFTTQFLSIVDPPVFRMEVVKGEDVAKYYAQVNYFERRGSLGGSCMACVPSNFFQIYVENPEQINMLVMLDQHDKVMGRAVLWNGADFRLMDRIYVCNDLYINYFYNWAKENKCYYKKFNNWSTPKHLIFNDEEVIKEFDIILDKSHFELYPYLDTFKWLDLETRKISNYTPKDNTNVICVSDHRGGHLMYNYFVFCDMEHDVHMSSEIVYIDYMNMNVYSGNAMRSYTLDRWIWKDHAVLCDEIRDYIFNEKYDQYNDHTIIEAKKKEYAEKRKKGEELKSGLRSSSGNGYDWGYNPYTGVVGTAGIPDVVETVELSTESGVPEDYPVRMRPEILAELEQG